MNLGYIALLLQKKLYSQAIEYMSNLTSTESQLHSTKIQYYKALCFTNLKIYDKALEFFDLVLASRLGFVYVYQCKMIKGYIYTKTNKVRLAELEFLDLIKNGYESTRVYSAIGHVIFVQGRVSEAAHMLQKSLNMDPHNTTALNSMSYVLAESNVKLDVALQFIRKALAKYPGNPAYLDTYGLVLCRLGRFKSATQVLERAYKLSQDPLVLKHMQMATKGRRK